jgi:flagellin
MAASRQIGVTKAGLTQAIERLTTGKRINRASDDAAGLATGTAMDANARSTAASVKGFQTQFFTAQAGDSALQEATNQATRLAELEGSGNTAAAEYTSVKGLVSTAALAGGMTAANIGTMLASATSASTLALSTIATARNGFAAQMATAQSQANLAGIQSESSYAQADNIMGADIGAETVNLTKFQIMMQAGTSALSQANQSSQSVLALFR